MQRYARIIDGIVIEVADLPIDVALSDVFPADLGFEKVSSNVEAGMALVGSAFQNMPLPGVTIELSTPAEKLAAFLSANPDVVALIGA